MILVTLFHLLACLPMAATDISTDQSALLALKFSITSDPLGILGENWSAALSVCHWAGVTCGSADNRVTALDIGNMALTGTIPPQLGNLSSLVYLNLSRNNFHGNLPHELGRLRRPQVLDFGVNHFTGEIPSSFGSLPELRFFSIANNSFTGFVPISIYNSSKLEQLWLHFNFLQGTVPVEVGNLLNLREYIVFGNHLSGSVPIELFNVSTLEWISVGMNYLSGSLPSPTCSKHHRLYRFATTDNIISGPLPSSFFNCSQLQILSIYGNNHSGVIPKEYGKMKAIRYFTFGVNSLTGEIPKELGNATSLEVISLEWNQLTGCIPEEIGYLPMLQQLDLSHNHLVTGRCRIRNRIPDPIGNLSSLILLNVSQNQLSGSVPSAITKMKKLQILDVGSNYKLSTISLEDLCGLPSLFNINLGENQFPGSIPECLGNIPTMRYIFLQENRFSGRLPTKLWSLKDLMVLNLSSNFLSGSLPLELGNLKMAILIDLSFNEFSGDLPKSIGDIQSLQILHLDHNQFQGSIPESIGEMLSLESLNLSHNKLSGLIPKSLERLQNLKYFNVSFNNLSGEIPSGGPFRNFTMESFFSNEELCGAYRFRVPPCQDISSPTLRTRKVPLLLFVLVGIGAIIGAVVLGAVYLRCKRKDLIPHQTNLLSLAVERISYYELLQATNGYDESNLLGKGSFGSVYKGILNDGRILAVKVFNLQIKGASKSFEGECEVLRNLHHRNLTKVISSCTNLDFKALVLEFIPNGSLEKWLYSHNYYLDVIQRLNIMIDVANALHYLHSGYSTPVIHCDLKPSNILLDQDMIAHVSDFGIAKILGEEDSITYTETLATVGYVAPEYGLEGLVSTKCDIYSFGIMLMEVFTRMRPNDEMFKENLSLKAWVSNSFPDSLSQIIDSNLMRENEEYISEKLECITSVMEVALNCSREPPKERSTIGDVIVALEKIKLQLLPYYRRV